MSARRMNHWSRLVPIAALLGCLIVLGLDSWRRTEYQRKAEATEWRWSKERASLQYCVNHNLRDYTVRTVRREDAFVDENLQILVLDGAEEVCTFRGHEETVFAQVDGVLYV